MTDPPVCTYTMRTFDTWIDRWIETERRRSDAAGPGRRPSMGVSPAEQRAPEQRDAHNGPDTTFPDDPPERCTRVGCGYASCRGCLMGRAAAAAVRGRMVSDGPTGAEAEQDEPPIADPVRSCVSFVTRNGGFASFWFRTRKHAEFRGLSVAAVEALSGARERRTAGYVVVRRDLPPERYLEVPFVRRAWRLLWLLDDGGGIRFNNRAGLGDGDAHPNAFSHFNSHTHTRNTAIASVSFDWSLARSLEMNPGSAQWELHLLISTLHRCGFLDVYDPRGLAQRSRDLIRTGSVGRFYKALFFRLFNRFPWGDTDGMPDLLLVQYAALYLTWIVTHATAEGCSAQDLQRALHAVARHLHIPADGSDWIAAPAVTSRVIRDRFLARVASMLGLVELSPSEERRPVVQPYRATSFARSVLRWQM